MTERGEKKNGMAMLLERVSIAILVALTLGSYLGRAEIQTKLAVMIEVQRRQTVIMEARATHEARLVAIEATRFTREDNRRERDAVRDHFDAQLLDIWKGLQKAMADIPEGDGKVRVWVQAAMDKLEARIRACEDKK